MGPNLISLEPLPIDSYLPSVIASLRRHGAVVLTAPPGAGKTTRIPRAIHDDGIAGSGEILVLQPRRLATLLAAARVAAELGEKPGGTVGFTMRFDTAGGPGTRIRFITEGVLSRRVIQDPTLRGVSVVVLDEFHERHVATDLALALLGLLRRGERPEMKIIVMSATMDPAAAAAFLDNAPVISCEGSCYPVDIEYEARVSDRPLHEKVSTALSKLVGEGLDGDVLVFLPGAAEIRQSAEILRPLAERESLAILPLHGDLPPGQQSLAVQPCQKRKIILATNVAETSVTVPGIAAVVDSGLARVAVHSSWTGIPSLRLVKISRASAEQRAGRAGRTRKGRVVRLYTRADLESRPERDLPEIKRSDLAETLLTIHGAGLTDPRKFPWFEAPPESALDAAENLLGMLAALDRSGRLTDTGRAMLRFPVHPRLARMIVEGERLHVAEDAACLAALLSERDIRSRARVAIGASGPKQRIGQAGSSDALELLDAFREAESARFEARRLLAADLDPNSVDRVRRASRQISRLLARPRRIEENVDQARESLQISVLAAFPDRVARRRDRSSRDLVLSVGGAARLSQASVVHEAPLLVAVDVEERRDQAAGKAGGEALVRIASAIEEEWLAALFPDRIVQQVELHWNARAARVDESRRTYYDQIILEEIAQPARPSAEVADMLAQAVLARDLTCFPDYSGIVELKVRLAILARHFPEEGIPVLDQSVLHQAIREICDRKRSFAELSRISLEEHFLAKFTGKQRDLLRRRVPDTISLGSRRNLKVHYEEGRPPWVESRLQDFFRVKHTPMICEGRIPLTVRLLAPNRRPVQITQDMAGFWQRHYPSLRRELQRRYPKHAWPDPEEM